MKEIILKYTIILGVVWSVIYALGWSDWTLYASTAMLEVYLAWKEGKKR